MFKHRITFINGDVITLDNSEQQDGHRAYLQHCIDNEEIPQGIDSCETTNEEDAEAVAVTPDADEQTEE